MKSRRARGTREETRKRECCSLARSGAARFPRLIRRDCSKAGGGLYFVMQLKGLCHDYHVHFGIPKSTQLRNHVTCPYSPRDLLKLAKKILEKDKIALASC